MSRVDQATSKRLLAVHGWSGVVLGLFLYVVVLTGAVAVFAHEIGEWSAGGKRAHDPLDRPIHDRLVELSETIDPAYLEEVLVFTNSGGAIMALFHTHETTEGGMPREVGVRFLLDPNTMEVLSRDEGDLADFPGNQEGALDDFIVGLHVSLHAPRPWGLWATGILGFVMLIAAISGIILHKHLFKDLFVPPRFSSLLLNRRDRHILAGSWSLPFGFLLAFTGAFFSFAGAIGLPVVAMVAFGGDQVKMIETVIGAPVAEDPRPAPVANLDAILKQSAAEAGSKPLSIVVNHWGRMDANVLVRHDPPEEALRGVNQMFNGVSGEYLGVKPDIGTEPSVGNTVIGLMGPLHFGNFGGVLSKSVWFALGLAMCYVTLTGLQLWTQRRAEQPNWAWMSRAVTTVGIGTAVALVGAAWAFFIMLPFGAASFWTPAGFLIVSAAAIACGAFIRDQRLLSQLLSYALAVGMVLTPMIRMAFGAPGWGSLFSQGQAVVIGMDLAMIIGGGLIALWAYRSEATSRNQSAAMVPAPAE